MVSDYVAAEGQARGEPLGRLDEPTIGEEVEPDYSETADVSLTHPVETVARKKGL